MARTHHSILERLARELADSEVLRAEVKEISQRKGQGPKPSETYIAWKHELNDVARARGVDSRLVLEDVIRRAIRKQEGRNARTAKMRGALRKARGRVR